LDYPSNSIWTVDPDGSDPRRIVPDARDPSFSGSGRRVAFVRSFNVWSARSDGTHIRQLTDDRGRGDSFDPGYAPNGKLIAFLRGQSQGEDQGHGLVYVMRADGTQERRLTPHRTLNEFPIFSPDSRRVVWSAAPPSAPLRSDLLVVDVDGRHRRRLTHPEHGGDFAPRFSHDGRQIVFNRSRAVRDGEYDVDVYVMDSDGGHVRRLTRTRDTDERFPSFSPDDRHIVFQSEPHDSPFYDSGDVSAMRADGSHRRRLTSATDGEFDPRYSPTGDAIVYGRWRGEQADLYTTRPDGSGHRRITTTGADEFPVVWLAAGSR
jgi:Tol biopolymer transport system component